jgi:hypothetical protein
MACKHENICKHFESAEKLVQAIKDDLSVDEMIAILTPKKDAITLPDPYFEKEIKKQRKKYTKRGRNTEGAVIA